MEAGVRDLLEKNKNKNFVGFNSIGHCAACNARYQTGKKKKKKN